MNEVIIRCKKCSKILGTKDIELPDGEGDYWDGQETCDMDGNRIYYCYDCWDNKTIPADIDPDYEAMRADLIPIDPD